jgi:hypothetical protein
MRESFFVGTEESFHKLCSGAREEEEICGIYIEDEGINSKRETNNDRTRSGWRALYARRVRHSCHNNSQLKEVRT